MASHAPSYFDLKNKWAKYIDVEGAGHLSGHKKNVVARMMENTAEAAYTGSIDPSGLLRENAIPVNFMGGSSSDPTTRKH